MNFEKEKPLKPEGGEEEKYELNKEELDKLFRGNVRDKIENRKSFRESLKEEEREKPERRKKEKRKTETIRKPEETRPIEEEEKGVPTPVGIPTAVGKEKKEEEKIEKPPISDLEKLKNEVIRISEQKERIRREMDRAWQIEDEKKYYELKEELKKLQKPYQEASDRYHRIEEKVPTEVGIPAEVEEELKKEEKGIRFTLAEEDKGVPTPVGIPTAVGKEKPKDSGKKIEDEIEELERRLRIYGPVGWYRKPAVQDLRYLGDRARLKELKKELKVLKKGKPSKQKRYEEEVKDIKKQVPQAKRKLTILSKKFAKRDFGVIEQTRMEDEQKKLEKEKKKLEKRLKKLNKKIKKAKK